jgi:MFS family permease
VTPSLETELEQDSLGLIVVKPRSARLYRGYVLAILLIAYAYNFLDRQVIAVALEAIKHDLALSDTQLGTLTGAAFAVFYSIVGLPIARWADKGQRPLIIALSLALLSVTVALCSVVGNFVQLMLVRVGVGTGEAGIVPPAHALIASYFSRSERLRAMSIFLLGGPLSMAVGYLAGGWITQWFGWRMAFASIALPGLILAGLVRFTIRDPRSSDTQRSSVVQQTAASAEAATSSSVSAIIHTLWEQATFRALAMAFVLEALCGNGLLQWLPVFFIRVHHMATGELGTWLALNWGVGNALGTLAGGYLTRDSTVNPERRQLKLMTLIAAVYVPINVLALLLPEHHMALALLFLAALVNALATAPAYALVQSLVPEHMRATAVAVLFLLSNLIGLGLGPIFVGALSDGLSSRYGVDALRFALLACTPGYFLVAMSYWKASRTVMADLAAVAGA